MFRNGTAELVYSNLLVDDNTIYATYNSILQAQTRTRMTAATFTNNVIGNSRSGVNLPTLTAGSVFSNNIIEDIDCKTDYYSNQAGAVLGVVDSTVANNTFRRITGVAALVLSGGRSADATYYPPSANSTVSGNTITYNSNATVPATVSYIAAVMLEPDTTNAAVNVGGVLVARLGGVQGVNANSITFSGNTIVNSGSQSAVPAVPILQMSVGTRLNIASATPNVIEGTTLDAQTGTTSLYALANRIADSVDSAQLGTVVLRSGNIYVTENSTLPTVPATTSATALTPTTAPSIQRGLNSGATGDTINVQSGTYPDTSLTASTNNLTLNISTGVNATAGGTFSAGLTLGTGIASGSLAGDLGISLTGNNSANTLTGNTGANTISGGDGADTLSGSDGADTLTGGAGDDVLNGDAGADTLNGGDDNDTLNGGDAADSLSGDAGNDSITGGAGNDIIDGGTGTDTAIFSGSYADYSFSFTGTAGNYTLVVTGPAGSTGADQLRNVEVLTFSGSGTTVRLAGFGGYGSIDAALAASAADEVILIEPATYNLSAAITLPANGMTLRGMSAGDTILQRTGNTVVSFSGRSTGTLASIGIKGGASGGAVAVVEPTTLTIDSAVIDDASKTSAVIKTVGNQTITIAFDTNTATLEVAVGSGTEPIALTSTARPIQITGGAGDDLLVVNFSTFTNAPPAITFDGGTGGNDILQVVGATGDSIVYTPSAASTSTNKQGTVTYGRSGGGSTTLTFANLEPVNASVPGGTVTISNSPSFNLAANNALTIANGTKSDDVAQPALVVSGTTNGSTIETIHVYNTTSLIIDTSTISGASNDDFTITSANASAASITNLTFNTGTDTTDSIIINGAINAAGNVSFTSPTISFATGSSNVTTTTGNISITGATGGSGITSDAIILNAGSGTVTIDGGGGTVNFDSSSEIITTNATTSAVIIRDAAGTFGIGSVSATSGSLLLGVSGETVPAYSQTPFNDIRVNRLAIESTGAIVLNGSDNQIATLGPINVAGSLDIYSGIAMSITAAISATSATPGSATINIDSDGQPLSVNANVSSNGNMVLKGSGLTVAAGVSINATGGTIELSATNAADLTMATGSTLTTTSTNIATGAVILHQSKNLQVGTVVASGGLVVLGQKAAGASNDVEGTITQVGTITADRLRVANRAGAVTLTSNNLIGTLESVDRGGNFSLRDVAGGLVITGPVDEVVGSGGSIDNNVDITAENGSVAINGLVRSGTAGNISITGLGITANASGILNATANSGTGTITLDATASSINLNAASQITSGNTTNVAVTVRDATTAALGNITANSGGVTIGVSSDVTGAVTQNGSSAITTGTLTVSTTSSVNLSGTTNLFTTLGAIATTGGLTVNDSAGGLTITGPITNSTPGTASITTVGAINGAGLITSPGITLSATTGIGNTTPLELAGTTLSITSSAGNIDVDNATASSTTVSTLTTTGGGTILFEQSGGSAVTFTTVSTTADGTPTNGEDDITLQNTAGSITVSSVTADGEGDVSVTTVTSGNVTLGSVTATDNNVTVTSAGSIVDDGNDASADVTSSTVTLSAGTAIGSSSNSVDLDVSTVTSITAGSGANVNTLGAVSYSTITANSSGNVVLNSAGTLTLPAFSSPGSVTITTSTGNISIAGITATGSAVVLSSAGNITKSSGD
ncbi:MAG: beta strand repeat-containing protein, partial [Planctomycetaceae bacterium]